jgi:hypothetical protein
MAGKMMIAWFTNAVGMADIKNLPGESAVKSSSINDYSDTFCLDLSGNT